MSSPTAEDVIDAFVDVVRDQLEDGESVVVPDLGTFSVEHQPSEGTGNDDREALTPPRNVVVFEPEHE